MRQQKRRVLGLVALGLGAALTIVGCGAGQITQTDTQVPAVNGANTDGDDMLIRNAAIEFPDNRIKAYAAGEDVPVSMTIANQRATNDELVSVSSEDVADASVEGSKQIVAGSVLVIAPDSASGVGEAAPGQPEQGSVRDKGEDPGQQKAQVGHAQVTFRGLKRDLRPGQTLKATFTFRDAGPLQVDIPIAAPEHPRQDQ